MNVTITKNEITATCTEPRTIDYCFCILNHDIGLENAVDLLMEVMPEDYDFIINKHKSEELFQLGVLQLLERKWVISLTYNNNGTTLKITNFK